MKHLYQLRTYFTISIIVNIWHEKWTQKIIQESYKSVAFDPF